MVALFSAYYPSHGGGMEFACAELARGLLGAGMQVDWVAQGDPVAGNVLSDHCTALPGTDAVYALTGVPMPLPMPWAIPAISRIAARSRVVVVAEANFVLSVIAFLAAKFHRKPIMLVQHVGEPSTVSRLARLIMQLGEKLAVRPMVRTADAVVCVSPVVARHFADVPKKAPCLTIGHGVDMAGFRLAASDAERGDDREMLRLPRDGKVACFVGRLTESKGIMVIAEMARRRPDWTFAVAGIGPVDPAGWGLPNVIATGQLSREDVARLYRTSDVTVLPSQSESYSLVVREALASGSAVVCSDQILETDGGLAPYLLTEAVDLADIAGTATRFAAALDRPRGASQQQGRDYVEAQCSWAAVHARYVNLVSALMAKTGGRRRALAAAA